MIFKDREDAGTKLGELIAQQIKGENPENLVVASLLRGGVIVGSAVSQVVGAPHIPLPVAKISAPQNPELALGAVCFDITYWEKMIIGRLGGIKAPDLAQYQKEGKKKFATYLKRFSLSEKSLRRAMENRHVILVDDGIVTGATMRAAVLYVSTSAPQKITVAAPIIFQGFFIQGIYCMTLHIAKRATALSVYYRFFPQISDTEVKKVFLTNR